MILVAYLTLLHHAHGIVNVLGTLSHSFSFFFARSAVLTLFQSYHSLLFTSIAIVIVAVTTTVAVTIIIIIHFNSRQFSCPPIPITAHTFITIISFVGKFPMSQRTDNICTKTKRFHICAKKIQKKTTTTTTVKWSLFYLHKYQM